MRSLLLLLALAAPLAAVEQLTVGSGGLSFLEAREFSERLSVTADSLWLWPVERGQNIAPEILKRGGDIFAVVTRQNELGATYRVLPTTPGIEQIADGNPGTAFSPAAIGIENKLDLYLDLGGHYGIEQIRFFPRLDRDHRGDFLQSFILGHNRQDLSSDGASKGTILLAAYSFLINAHQTAPNDQTIVVWPRPNEITDEKEMRYVRIRTLEERPWEIAEIEITANGFMPSGTFDSRALEVRNAAPVWGRILVNGQAAKHVIDNGFGCIELVSFCRPESDVSFRSPLNHFFVENPHPIQNGIRVSMLVAQAENGDFLAGEIYFVQILVDPVPIILQLTYVPGWATYDQTFIL